MVVRSVSARDAPAQMSRRPITRFVNRSDELRQLSKLEAQPRAQLVIVSARPGQGKTTLVRQWLRAGGHTALYWTAERGAPDNQLRSFSQALLAYLHPRERPAADWTYPDWKAALRDLGQQSERRRHIVVIDDFDILLEADRGVASDVKVTWDLVLEHSQAMLILVSAQLIRLHADGLSYLAPLYGRPTAHFRLRPLSWGNLARAMPGLSAEDRVALLAATGGLPAYLQKIDPRWPRDANLRALLADRDYQDSLKVVLGYPHLRPAAAYRAILAALTHGAASPAVLARQTGLSERQVYRRLIDLEILRLTFDDSPVVGPYHFAARGRRAQLMDFQAGFAARFVAPYLARLRRGDDRAAWQAIRRGLDSYIGAVVFPELCWEWLVRECRAGRLVRAGLAGGYWAPGRPTIEFLLINEDSREAALGITLWSRQPMGPTTVNELIRWSQRIQPRLDDRWRLTYVFFSRAGFAPEARQAGQNYQCQWVSLEAIDRALARPIRSRA
jgi:hypothetical protein